ncbi:MAG: mannose-1-phosphate guanylyltransferase [Chitinivibrionales bacterium]
MKIVPVLLAGGIGERFWPMSRSTMPKQMLPLISSRSMIEETLARVESFCQNDIKPLIVTGQAISDKISETIGEKIAYDCIVEPVGKNTAPAVAAAAAFIHDRYGDAIMVVLSADHAISPVKDFVTAVTHAAELAQKQNKLVVFGIKPSRPDTGYGYVECGEKIGSEGAVHSFEVSRFVEKPDAQNAQQYLEKGNFLWNSGMFVWSVSTILDEFKAYMPVLFDLTQKLAEEKFSQDAVDAFYQEAEKESIDYGIMEKSRRVAVISGTFTWDDIGSWESMSRLHPADEHGTTVYGDRIFASDCTNSIVVNNANLSVAALGVDNLVIVTVDDAVLVIPRDRLPEIKTYMAEMKKDSSIPPTLF